MTFKGQFEAIIFDMDGLLVDSETVWEEAENAALVAHGVTPDPAVRSQLVGLRNDVFLARMIEIYRMDVSIQVLHDDVIGRML